MDNLGLDPNQVTSRINSSTQDQRYDLEVLLLALWRPGHPPWRSTPSSKSSGQTKIVDLLNMFVVFSCLMILSWRPEFQSIDLLNVCNVFCEKPLTTLSKVNISERRGAHGAGGLRAPGAPKY